MPNKEKTNKCWECGEMSYSVIICGRCGVRVCDNCNRIHDCMNKVKWEVCPKCDDGYISLADGDAQECGNCYGSGWLDKEKVKVKELKYKFGGVVIVVKKNEGKDYVNRFVATCKKHKNYNFVGRSIAEVLGYWIVYLAEVK